MTSKLGRNVSDEIRHKLWRDIRLEVGDEVRDAVGIEGWEDVWDKIYKLTGRHG